MVNSTWGDSMGRTGLFFFFFLSSVIAFADNTPDCLMDKGTDLPVNNEQVLEWKIKTKNQFHSRGHIKGRLTKTYSDKTNHLHWQVQIGPKDTDTIEVIYNKDFGKVTQFAVGSEVEACGDYITANKKSNGYPASPDGALVHWIHMSPSPNHLHGYMMVDNAVHGQDYKD